MADDASFGVGGVTFTDQTNKHIHIGNVGGLGEISEGVPGVTGVRLKFGDGDVRGSADIGKAFGDALRIFVLFVWDEYFEIGVPCVVGIAIGHEIDATATRVIDYVDVRAGFALDRDGTEFDVRVLHRDVRAFGDGDFLVESCKGFVGFVANVGHVDSAVLGGYFSEGDELSGVRVAADFVLEAGR